MLWLALHFPSLPLEIFTRGAEGPGPVVVAVSGATHAEIVTCSQEARRCGIHAGMAVAGAWALASGLRIFARDEAAERDALDRIAAWALQFSPNVSVAAPR
jgi:protein ImuB